MTVNYVHPTSNDHNQFYDSSPVDSYTVNVDLFIKQIDLVSPMKLNYLHGDVHKMLLLALIDWKFGDTK